ncbi:MAG: hypothetical protein ABJA77_14710 [Variovorax sp.]
MTDHASLYGTSTLAAVLMDAVRRYPQHIAFVGEHRDVSYQALGERVAQTIAVLRELGLRPGDTEAAELIAMVRKSRGAVHIPKSIEFTDSLPLTPLGKIDKKALRAPYWADAGRAVH